MIVQREDLVIVGAGPAGLAAADAARSLQPLVLEAGLPVDRRLHNEPSTTVRGVGGAGLYSDGKFSFWPSATALWELREDLLRTAYEWLVRRLKNVKIPAPDFPEISSSRRTPQMASDGEKRYPSVDSTLDTRKQLISQIVQEIPRLRTEVIVEGIDQDAEGWVVSLDRGRAIRTRQLLLATGRLGPLLVASALPAAALRMLRLEAGVRLQQPSSNFFLESHPQLDPKYVWRDEQTATEWRTFCCCRQGLIVQTSFDGLLTVSGRADCPATGLSNVGFNVRIFDQAAAESAWEHLSRAAGGLRRPVTQGLVHFLRDAEARRPGQLATVLGTDLAARLAAGLRLLVGHFASQDLSDAVLVGPTLEGVGMYPTHDDMLATAQRGLWVAGDVSGTFRGLTAALVSGNVAGQAIVQTPGSGS